MSSKSLAIIGGTGALGRALALRALRHGVRIFIGSRDEKRAQVVADQLRREVTGAVVIGAENEVAARKGELIVVTVPFANQLETLRAIRASAAGKIVIDATVPLVPPRVARVQLPIEGSAAVRAQSALGSDIRVVSALHTVAAARLGSDFGAEEIGDVLVFGDEKASREVVVDFFAQLNLFAFHGGPLVNAAATEAFTSVLIFLNKNYGAAHAGLKIIGISPSSTG